MITLCLVIDYILVVQCHDGQCRLVPSPLQHGMLHFADELHIPEDVYL